MVSVIVPIYNVEKYLEDCLLSLKNQNFDDYEVLLIDDGSSDNSSQIAKKFAEDNKRFFYFKKENEGLSSARNYGIDRANGEWLMFVDSDDMVSSDYIKVLYNLVISHKCLLGVCKFSRFRDIIPPSIDENKSVDVCSSNFYLKEMFSSNFMVACNKIYHKSLFTSIRYPYKKIHEDFATTYKIIDLVDNLVITSKSLYFYRINECSITKSKIKVNKIDLLEICKEQIIYFKQKSVENKNAYHRILKKVSNNFFVCFGTLVSYSQDNYENYSEFYAEIQKFYSENYKFLKTLPLSFANKIILLFSFKKIEILKFFAIIKRKIK